MAAARAEDGFLHRKFQFFPRGGETLQGRLGLGLDAEGFQEDRLDDLGNEFPGLRHPPVPAAHDLRPVEELVLDDREGLLQDKDPGVAGDEVADEVQGQRDGRPDLQDRDVLPAQRLHQVPDDGVADAPRDDPQGGPVLRRDLEVVLAEILLELAPDGLETGIVGFQETHDPGRHDDLVPRGAGLEVRPAGRMEDGPEADVLPAVVDAHGRPQHGHDLVLLGQLEG